MVGGATQEEEQVGALAEQIAEVYLE